MSCLERDQIQRFLIRINGVFLRARLGLPIEDDRLDLSCGVVDGVPTRSNSDKYPPTSASFRKLANQNRTMCVAFSSVVFFASGWGGGRVEKRKRNVSSASISDGLASHGEATGAIHLGEYWLPAAILRNCPALRPLVVSCDVMPCHAAPCRGWIVWLCRLDAFVPCFRFFACFSSAFSWP